MVAEWPYPAIFAPIYFELCKYPCQRGLVCVIVLVPKRFEKGAIYIYTASWFAWWESFDLHTYLHRGDMQSRKCTFNNASHNYQSVLIFGWLDSKSTAHCAKAGTEDIWTSFWVVIHANMDQFQQIVILNFKAMISIQIHLQTAVQTMFPHGWCPQALSPGRDHRAGSGLPTPSQTTTQNAKRQITPPKNF